LRPCISAHKSPVEANNGYLCAMCYDGLRNALMEAPRALQHLREVYVMRPSVDMDGSKPLKKDPPAPFNLDAFQLAEDMWEALTGTHIPVDWNHLKLYGQAHSVCQDLHQKIDTVANQKEVVYLMPVVSALRQALFRYPLEEKARTTLLPCPSCNYRTIYTPPESFGDELEVKCHNCQFVIPPEKMEFYAHLAEQERAR